MTIEEDACSVEKKQEEEQKDNVDTLVYFTINSFF